MGWRRLFGLEPAPTVPAPEGGAAAPPPAEEEPSVGAGAADDVLAQIATIRSKAQGNRASAMPALAAAMESDWRAVRIAAAESMAAIAQREGAGFVLLDVADIPPEGLRRRRDDVQRFGEEQIQRHVRGLLSADSLVRLAAAEVLGETGSVAAARALIGALNDSDWAVVSQANEALRALGSAAIPALIEADGRDANVRAGIDWCLDMLSRDADPAVREAATQAQHGLSSRR